MAEPPDKPPTGADVGLGHVDHARVGQQARTGAVWSFIQIAVRNVVGMGTTAVLARLLTPDDYGLMGMVATLVALLTVFADMGLSSATIQKRNLEAIQVSNLYWINAAAGAALWLLCIVAAPYVARFYDRTELRLVVAVLGASFLVGGLAAQPFAVLRRKMNFRLVAEIEMTALVASAASAIIAALYGLGYWALVIQSLTGQTARMLLALTRSGIILRRPRRDPETRRMVSFGGTLVVNGILIYVARNLDGVMIGRVWGSEQLGYYDRAYFLMLLPSMLATGVLTNLMVPSLAALQSDNERFGNAYRRAVRLVAFVGCPIATGLALTASEAVRLMYGERWMPVVPMLLGLSFAAITQPIYNTTGWLFTAKGKARPYFVVTLVNAVTLTLTFAWSVRMGSEAVAMAYGLMAGLVLIWPTLWMAHRAADLRLGETLRALAPVCASVLLMAASSWLSGRVAAALALPWEIVLGVKVFAGVAAYALAARTLLASMMRADLLPMLPRKLALAGARWVK